MKRLIQRDSMTSSLAIPPPTLKVLTVPYYFIVGGITQF